MINLEEKGYKVRVIRDSQDCFDLAIVYFEKGRPVAFRRYRPELNVTESSVALKKQMQVMQHIMATALRYGFVNTKKLNLREL
jgi:hypothetical protein